MMRLAVAFFALATLAKATTVPDQPQDWLAWMEKGNALRRAGNFAEAVTAFQEAVKTLESSQADVLSFASALNSVATAYDDMGRLLEAEKYYRRALDVAAQAAGLHSVSRAQILVNFGCSYLHRGDTQKADNNLREALSIYDALIAPDSPLVAVARSYLAATLLQRGSLDDANQLMELSLPVLARTEDHEGVYGMTLNNLGSLRWEQHRHAESIELFRQSLAALEHLRGLDSPALLYPLNNLASAKFNAGAKEEASALYSRAVRIAQVHIGPYSTLYGHLLYNYAACLRKTGHKPEAKTMEARAAAISKDTPGAFSTGLTVDISALRAK
jgi:tetratricopeptide (TPR) repeat protein